MTICEFRTAKIYLDGDPLPYVVDVGIEEKWETVSFPVYQDSSSVRTLPTLRRITAHIRKKHEPENPLHALLNGNPLLLEFEAEGETLSFAQAMVIEWKVTGKLGGEMMEEVMLSCEAES